MITFCPYVAGYIRQHPAYTTLVPSGYRDLLEEAQGSREGD